MRTPTYNFNDEDHERFVLGDPGGINPGPWIVLAVVITSLVLWWFK